jgi:hypothetical protein
MLAAYGFAKYGNSAKFFSVDFRLDSWLAPQENIPAHFVGGRRGTRLPSRPPPFSEDALRNRPVYLDFDPSFSF